MKSSKSLLFDLGNVLLPIDLDKTYQAFADLSTRFGFEEVKQLITQNSLWREYEAGLQSSSEFRDFLKLQLALHCSDEQFDKAFSALLLDFHAGIFDWLQNLTNHYSIYLLSNTSKIHAEIFTNISLGPNNESLFVLFDQIFYSFEIGLVKPNPEIYQHVLNELNILPNDLLFFDDNESNILAAQKLGIDAVHIIDPSKSISQINQKLASLC
jgi:HAD superfamily hydrolase (TIGR01509 family)